MSILDSLLLVGIIALLIFIFLFILNGFVDTTEYYYQTTCMDLNNDTTRPYLIKNESGVYCRLQDGTFEDITLEVQNG